MNLGFLCATYLRPQATTGPIPSAAARMRHPADAEGAGSGSVGGLLRSSDHAPVSIVGTDVGRLLVMEGGRIRDVLPAHGNAAFVSGFITGGCDGLIILWSNDLEQRTSMDIASFIMPLPREIADTTYVYNRIFGLDYSEGKVIVGTDGNELLEVDMFSRQCTLILSHHCTNVSGLATHPTATEFLCAGSSVNRDATAGDLGVMVWDYSKRIQVMGKSKRFGSQTVVTAATWTPIPRGRVPFIVLGTRAPERCWC